MEQVEVVHDPGAALPEAPDGQRLFAEPYQCPPPTVNDCYRLIRAFAN